MGIIDRTSNPKHPQRLQQAVELGLGRAFRSPRKARPKKTAHLPFGFAVAQRAGMSRLQHLMGLSSSLEKQIGSEYCNGVDNSTQADSLDTTVENPTVNKHECAVDASDPNEQITGSPDTDLLDGAGDLNSSDRRNKAQDKTQAAYDRWLALIPSLVEVLLDYQCATYRGTLPEIPGTLSLCSSPDECSFSFAEVKCLLLSRK
jgi:hypothetical protein